MQRRIRNYAPHALYINCRNHRLALCFTHLRDSFPWLETIDTVLLGLWKTFYFSSKNKYILNEIQNAYGMKALSIVKAALTRWLSHGAAVRRCRERYPVIIEALDDIISKDPKAETIGIRDQLLKPITLKRICFLEDVLTITNILSLVLQSDHKEFGALKRAISTTISHLKEMRDNPESNLLKIYKISNQVVETLSEYNQQLVVSHSTRKRYIKIKRKKGFETSSSVNFLSMISNSVF